MKKNHNIIKWAIGAWVIVFMITAAPVPCVSQTYTTLNGPWQARNENDVACEYYGSTVYAADLVFLFKSTDNGSTWAASASQISNPLVVRCKPDNSNYVVVGKIDTIFQSTDGGSTWNNALTGSNGNLQPLRLAVSPISTQYSLMFLGKQYVNGSYSFYYSSDRGASWTARTGFSYASSVYDITPHPVSGSRSSDVWAVGSDGTTEGTNQQQPAVTRGVWWSADLGASWSQKNMGDFNGRAIGVRDRGSDWPALIVGTASGKLFRSTNGGDNWTQCTTPTGVTTITAVVARSDAQEFFAATNNGVYATFDDGATWAGPLGDVQMPDKNVLSLAIVPYNQNVIYAGTAYHMYSSTSGGASWTEVDNGLGRMPISSAYSSAPNVWTVSKDFSYASKYNGTQWSRTVLGGSGETFSGEKILRHSQGNLFASGAVDNVAILYRSTDGGSTFSQNYKPSTYTGTDFYGIIEDPINNYLYLFGYAKISGGTVRNWFRSTNAGSTWDETFTPIGSSSSTVQDMVAGINGSGQNMLAAIQNGGIQRSTSGGAGWSQVFPNPTTDVKSLTCRPNANASKLIYAATATGVWKNTNYGASGSWMNIHSGAHKRVAMCPGVGTDSTYVAAILDDGSKVYYSPNAGGTWFDVTANLPTSINGLFGEGSTSGTMYVATGSGTYKITEPSATTLISPANGSSPGFDVVLQWNAVSNATVYHLLIAYDANFTNLLLDAKNITGTSYSPMNLINNTQYYWKVAANNIAGESDFSSSRSFTVSAQQSITLTITINGNQNPVLSWSSETSSEPYKIYRYNCPYPGDCGGEEEGYNSGRGSGAQPNSSLPPACDCNPHPETSPYPLLATTTQTTYTDVGVTVDNIDPNTAYFYEVRRVNYSNKGSVLSKIYTKTSHQPIADGHIPGEMKLELNYPNPFNPATSIKYSLSEDAFVVLKVYDVLGREVVTLVNEFEKAGYKSVEFDARLLSSGLYIYRLNAGKFADVKKMMLVK